jgi:hypothetical protein
VLQGIDNYSPDIDLVTTMEGAYIMEAVTVAARPFGPGWRVRAVRSHFGIFEVEA